MHDHRHKKQLGQHFLHDPDIIDRIVRAIDPQPGDTLVEIGPGAGAITLPLLRRHGTLRVIEFDRDLLAPLQRLGDGAGRLEIVHADVLDVDFSALAGATPIRLVGNLPYNISSPILFHAIEHAAVIRDMHFMLQKEVVDRMAAAPGNKVYGRLSVMLQAACHVTPLFRVPPGAFRPPPKVDSAVVRLLPRAPQEVGLDDPAMFARVVKAAFAQRRKTLRNALDTVCDAEALHQAGISPTARAETVAVADFIVLANLLARQCLGTDAMPAGA
jgi:16S rRNA (adenine1518-N6/adenine1519-N6)-dimethyltransferase